MVLNMTGEPTLMSETLLTLTVEADWEPTGPDEDPELRLLTSVRLQGPGYACDLHTEAWEVYDDDDGVQQAAWDALYDDFNSLHQAMGGDGGPFSEVEINGRRYVIVLTPYRD